MSNENENNVNEDTLGEITQSSLESLVDESVFKPVGVEDLEETIDSPNLHAKVSVEEALKSTPIETLETIVESTKVETVKPTVTEIPPSERDIEVVESPVKSALDELMNTSPVIEVESTEKKPQDTPEKEKLTRNETIVKLAKAIPGAKVSEVEEIWKGHNRQTLEEVKEASKPIEIDPKYPIYSNIEAVENKNTVEFAKRMINSISLPSDTREKVMDFIASNPAEIEKSDFKWAAASAQTAAELIGFEEDTTNKTLNSEDTILKQRITLPDGTGRVGVYRIGYGDKDRKLTGIEARSAISNALGLGSDHVIVLPHSGLVAIVSAPTAHSLIDFQYSIDNAKISMGRAQGGSNYGLTNWFINQRIVELFIDRIVDINLSNKSADNIMSLIDPMDIPAIAHGLACSMYPDGFPFNRVAMLDEGKMETVLGKIWLPDISFYVENRLSIRQKQHLAKSYKHPSSNEEIESYKRDWKNEDEVKPYRKEVFKRRILKGGKEAEVTTFIDLSSCNMPTYIMHGSSWDKYLTDALNSTMSMVADEKQRNHFLTSKMVATQLRDSSYWVDNIHIETKYLETGEVVENDIDDLDDIIANLEEMTRSEQLRTTFIEAVNGFIDDTIKVIFGVPTVSDYEKKHNTHPISNCIVPINPVSTFFTLAAQIYRELGIREDKEM